MIELLTKLKAFESLHFGIRAGLTDQDPSMATPKIGLEKFNGKMILICGK